MVWDGNGLDRPRSRNKRNSTEIATFHFGTAHPSELPRKIPDGRALQAPARSANLHRNEKMHTDHSRLLGNPDDRQRSAGLERTEVSTAPMP